MISEQFQLRSQLFFRWRRTVAENVAAIPTRLDGSFTADFEEIDALLHETWMPIFWQYAGNRELPWDSFRARSRTYIAQHG
eukprot:5574106-Karenia_brevis.AAC.1